MASLPTSMRRVVAMAYNHADPSGSLMIQTVPLPAMGPNEVLVRVTVRPINPSDVAGLQGGYPGFAPASFPAVPGQEGVGVVAAVGSEVDPSTSVGKRVIVRFNAKNGYGSWQEARSVTPHWPARAHHPTQYVVVSPSHLSSVPDSVSDDAASQFFVNPLTVMAMLDKLNPPPGSFVVQSAGGSTLGRLMVAMAAKRGVKIISVVRRAEQADELLALGAAAVVSSQEDIGAKVRTITDGAMAWGATDCLANIMVGRLASAVRRGGSVLVYGALTGMRASVGVADLMFKDVSIHGFWLGPWLEEQSPQKLDAMTKEVMDSLSDGTLAPSVGEKFPLAQVAQAVRVSLQPARKGKVLLV